VDFRRRDPAIQIEAYIDARKTCPARPDVNVFSKGWSNMKALILTVGLLTALPAAAERPMDLSIQSVGTFDAARVYSAVFTASGAIADQGNAIYYGVYTGEEVHITDLMTTSSGDYITLAINGNHVAGGENPPTWCPPPSAIPPGAVLRPQVGNWTVVTGTGKYSTFQGTGSWAAWVVFDVALSKPLWAKDCLTGHVHDIS
jgi:hypothetical protein